MAVVGVGVAVVGVGVAVVGVGVAQVGVGGGCAKPPKQKRPIFPTSRTIEVKRT